MAVTQLLSSINKSNTYPKSVSISAPDSCGMLILMPNSEISEQQLFELPTINVKIFDSSGKVFLNKDINLSAIDFNAIVTKQADPYSVPIYNIPSDCICSVTPIFDTNAFRCHNETVLNGNIGSFTTSETGIVDTNTEDYKSLLWETPTNTFDISVSFDNSNISSGGSGGGSSVTIDTSVDSSSTNPVQNKAIYNFVTGKLSSNDARFISTFNSVAEMEAYSGEVANNDYAYVKETTSSGITYNKYKWSNIDSSWNFEYQLNTSPFTAEQLATINSGLTASDKTNYNNGLTELNSLKTNVGNLSSLETETKTNIVSSINELLDAIKELQTLSIEVKEISQ